MTRSLAALEERVGARWFNGQGSSRQPIGAAPCFAGARAVRDYEQVVGRVKESRDAPLDGLLRITAPTLFGRWHIAPLVSRFLSAFGCPRRALLTNRNLDLVEESLDIAVRIGPLSEPGLIARRVGQVYRVLSASPNYIARCGRPRTPKDLLKHDIVFVSFQPLPMSGVFAAAVESTLRV